MISERATFSSDDIEVSVEYDTHKPYESRSEKVTRLKMEVEAKFTSIESAMKELHPDMSDTELAQEMEDIAEGLTVEVPANNETMPTEGMSSSDMEENNNSR